jgi:hypothetical protein
MSHEESETPVRGREKFLYKISRARFRDIHLQLSDVLHHSFFYEDEVLASSRSFND